ncbi:MAG TPA: TIGR00730 family Rossman fold protein, partial [Flavobacteriia bacterium]|nr:TIGR00730 family Rossman fold protein [Flavobacteriia bacterium]
GLFEWVKEVLIEKFGNATLDDLGLIKIVDTEHEVVDVLNSFYKKYSLSPNF